MAKNNTKRTNYTKTKIDKKKLLMKTVQKYT